MLIMRPSETAIQRRDRNGIDKDKADNDKRLALRDVGVISGVAVGGLGLLIILSLWLAVGRVPFIVGAAVPLFTLLAVIYQAVVYRRQWNVMQDSLAQTDLIVGKMQGQLDAAKDQLDAMNRQTEHAQRAYLGIHSANLNVGQEITGGDQFFLFTLRLKNTGNTPAYNVGIVLSTGIAVDPPDPALPSTSDIHVNGGMVGPNAELKNWARAPEPRNEQNKLWVDGKLQVYCSGVITYGTFGKTRTTKFCVLRRPGSMELEPYGKWYDGD